MDDNFNLQRFIEAQDAIYEAVLKELMRGGKVTHWIWYIFPQVRDLGHSPMAKQFAINSKEEARAYLEHPILGERLRSCTQLVINTDERTTSQIFGYTDNLKFRSSMTLFNSVGEKDSLFECALVKYYEGKPDKLTIDILNEL